MIKQTLAALLLTTSVASAADMMMNDKLDDQNYVDVGAIFAADEEVVQIGFSGRNGNVEYKAQYAEENDVSLIRTNLGAVVGKGNFGVSAGIGYTGVGADPLSGVESVGFTNGYVAAIYDGTKWEGRVQYNTEVADLNDTDTIELSTRFHVSDSWSLQASVESSASDFSFENDESLANLTVGYKF